MYCAGRAVLNHKPCLVPFKIEHNYLKNVVRIDASELHLSFVRTNSQIAVLSNGDDAQENLVWVDIEKVTGFHKWKVKHVGLTKAGNYFVISRTNHLFATFQTNCNGTKTLGFYDVSMVFEKH